MRHTDPHQHGPALGHRPRCPLLALNAFTLVELMVTLAIVAILLAAAVPDVRGTLERHALRAAAGELMAALHQARSQAISRGATIVVAPLDDAGVAWRDGWAVFADDDGDARPGPGERVLYRHGPLRDGVRVWSRLTAAAPPRYVAYNSAGRSCRANNHLAANWGTVSLQLGSTNRNIIINMLGRARLCDPHREPNCHTADE